MGVDQGDLVGVLLLDDVLSELDEGRREVLLGIAKKAQTLITCTEFEGEGADRMIAVSDGKAEVLR